MKAGSLSGKAVSSILLSCLEIPYLNTFKQLNPIKLFKWSCSNNLPQTLLHLSPGDRWEAGLASIFCCARMLGNGPEVRAPALWVTWEVT